MVQRTPSLNWLRVFEAAARTESFARAAAQLNMSPAAVSQQVKALEDRLGTPLFHRHAHAVSLTDAGRAYLAPVSQSLIMLEGATEGLFGAARQQQLFVQSVLIFAVGLLSDALPDFEQHHPDIGLMLSTGNSAPDFSTSYSDLKIVFGNPRSFGRESDRMLGERLYPMALPQIAEQISGPADLLEHRLIEVATHRSGWQSLFDHAQVMPGRARFLFADSTIMAGALASAGLGIALARAPASDKILQGAGLVPCLDGVEAPGTETYHLVYNDLTTLRPPARRFREWVLDRFSG